MKASAALAETLLRALRSRQSGDNTLDEDLHGALQRIAPICAAACAGRFNRTKTVLPKLRAVLDDVHNHADDPNAFAAQVRRFRAELIAGCGNTALSLLGGTLARLLEARADAGREVALERRTRLKIARDHERLYALIAKGDEDRSEKAAHVCLVLDIERV